MRFSRKKKTKVTVVEDLSYLSDRTHRYNWIQRHYHHHRLRRRLKKSYIVIARNEKVATDIHRFYFIPKTNIIIREDSVSDKESENKTTITRQS